MYISDLSTFGSSQEQIHTSHQNIEKYCTKMVKKIYSRLDKGLQKIVETEAQTGSTLLVSVRDGLITCSGSSNIVSFVQDQDLMSLTVHELFHKINYEESSNIYDESTALWFPKMKRKFKGPGWNWSIAYQTLKSYFNVLGFKKGGNKHFGNPDDKPSSFPDSIAWESFKHPGSEKIDRINTVIHAILEFHGISADEHHEEEEETNVAGTTQDDDIPASQDDLPVSVNPVPPVNPAPPVYPASPSASSSATPMPMLGKSSTTPAPSFSSNFIGRGLVPDYSDSESESDTSTNVTYHDESDLDMSDKNNNADDKNGNKETENEDEVDEEESTSDIGKQYLAIRQKNIGERQQLLKDLFPENEAADIPKPRKKKLKTHQQPKKVTSSTYSLRRNPSRNKKYFE